MRVFLDSNVWISAFATRGLCADLVRSVLKGHQRGGLELLVSATVRQETRRILADKLGASTQELALVDKAMSVAREIEPSGGFLSPSLSDPADRAIVAAALAGEAAVLVTGDKELLALAEVEGMRILPPRAAWDLLFPR